MDSVKSKLLFVAISILTFVVASCTGSNEAKDQKEAAQWYQFEFGSAPPSAVTDIYAKQVAVRDSVMAWLRFQADDAIYESLRSKGFTSATNLEFTANTEGASMPVWWTITPNMKFNKIENWNKGFANSSGYLAYDSEAKTIYFCHSGVD